MAKGSRAIEEMRGESGHPWLAPLYRLKGEDVMPLHNTDAMGSIYNNCIQARNVGPKPNLFSA